MNGWPRMVAQVGFPIAMALLLFGLITGLVPSAITRTEAKVDRHIEASKGIRPLLRQICRNVARTDFDRAGCDLEGQ